MIQGNIGLLIVFKVWAVRGEGPSEVVITESGATTSAAHVGGSA